MGIFRATPVAFGASAALAVLAGCAGGNSPAALSPGMPGVGGQSAQRQIVTARPKNSVLPPYVALVSNERVATASFMDPDSVSKPLVFVSDAANGVVDIYRAGGGHKVVGQITGLTEPQGLTTDAARNLYVANTNSSDVLVYAPPYTGSPTLTISDPGEFPVDVAVSSEGVVAVTNICNAPSCSVSTANVDFYAQGATTNCASVSDSAFNFAQIMFAAFDAKGDLYIDGLDGGYATSFGLVTGGCAATSIASISPSAVYTLSFPGGIQIDKHGRIGFTDSYRRDEVTFNPPLNGAFTRPTSVIVLTGTVSPLGYALLASGKDIYVADPGGSGIAAEYPYPRGDGSALSTIAVGGQPIGVAVTPPITQEDN